MITFFSDQLQTNAHRLFQDWRAANPSGYFINCKGPKNSLLHDAACSHLGDTDWGGEEYSTLTEKRKVCARTTAELRAWAIEHHLPIGECKHCKRRGLDDKAPAILSRAKYAASVRTILSSATLVVAQEEFKIGADYTRREIHETLGGDLQSYLPTVHGRVVCACLCTDINPKAPNVILVGKGPRIERAGNILANQRDPIPVFIKDTSNAWTNRGLFRVRHSSQRPAHIRPYAPAGSRSSITRVIHLQSTPPRAAQVVPVPDIEADEISAREGAIFTRQHLHRERDRKIIVAKRRQMLAKTGRLACSVCSFDFQQFYGEIGAKFCEVHHLCSLADADGEVRTRLKDLAVVCSNCHRMLHRSHPFLTVEQLKSKIRNG